ncbi:hypothetical protein E6C67_26855 [Azospirillum sp. TSA2s]|nr:hypothetical protein E6C67_26855 [Azospirillum sp. TSA2s]
MAGKLISNFAESFVDNVIRDTVYPVPGSVVYCELTFGLCEHSGIYIGGDEIVHLDGSGYIERVSSKEFLERLKGLNTAISIYVSCEDKAPARSSMAVGRAKEMVGHKRAYNVILDNCHQFTSGCLTGNFNNTDNFLWMLKDTARREIGANSWRVWNRPPVG